LKKKKPPFDGEAEAKRREWAEVKGEEKGYSQRHSSGKTSRGRGIAPPKYIEKEVA